MMIRLAFLLSILALSTSATAAGYKDTEWGMSRADVRSKVEVADESDEMILVSGPVAGNDALTGYMFTQDRLTTVRVIFTKVYSNKNGYLEKFLELKGLLSKKYGEPTRDDVTWKNDLYKDDVESWGMAVSVGHLVFASGWATEDTEIGLVCAGNEFKITLMLEYESHSLRGLAAAEAEKSKLDDL